MFERWKPVMARAATVAASFIAAALTIAAVGLAFGVASSQPWLRDTPQAREQIARCSALAGRAARRDCVNALVAEARARDTGVVRLAESARAVHRTPEVTR